MEKEELAEDDEADVEDWAGMEKRIKNLEDAVADLKADKENVSVETEEVEVTSNKRQVSNPVAPATRNSNKNPRKIHLTQSQVSIARRLNITPEQYANQLLKES